MSSYAFEDARQGPPLSSPLDEADGCGGEWICEHRRETIANLVAFRGATRGAELVNWQIVEGTVISFGRGDRGHIVINTGDEPTTVGVAVGLPADEYTDIVAGATRGAVGTDGVLSVTVDAKRAFAILSPE